jgi:hypothetical protein
MNDNLISRKVILDYLITEKEKLIEGFNKDNDVIPIEARKGALLSIKAMTNFINQLRKEEQIN